MQTRLFVMSQDGQNDVKSQTMEYLGNSKSTGLKFCKVDVLEELHIVIVVMMSPYQLACYQTSAFLK